MENTKKSKKFVNGLVYVLVLVLIGVVVYQNHQIRTLSLALESADESTGKIVHGQDDNTQNAATSVTTTVAKRNGPEDYDNLIYQLDAAEEELDMAHEQLAEEIARKDETSMAPPSPMAMLQTSEGRKQLRNALKNGFDQTYGGLFKELNLSPEKIDQLKELLADQRIKKMELNTRLADGGPPTMEEIQKYQESIEALDNQNDAELEDLIGSEALQALNEYDDRSRERMMIQMFSQSLSFDDTLNGVQKKSLLESLYNKRKDTYAQRGFEEGSITPPADIADGEMPPMMELNLLVYDEYIKGVEEAGLTESQEKELKDFLEKEQARMKSSMERQARIASGEIDPETAQKEMEEEGGTIIIMN
jgi:hypothetical protein